MHVGHLVPIHTHHVRQLRLGYQSLRLCAHKLLLQRHKLGVGRVLELELLNLIRNL